MKTRFKLIKEEDALKRNYWKKSSRYTEIVDKCIKDLTPGMAFQITLPKDLKVATLRNHFYGHKVSHLKLCVYSNIPFVVYPRRSNEK